MTLEVKLGLPLAMLFLGGSTDQTPLDNFPEFPPPSPTNFNFGILNIMIAMLILRGGASAMTLEVKLGLPLAMLFLGGGVCRPNPPRQLS